MKPNAIVYTSNTGYTRQYAELLGGETGLPVYSLDDAKKEVQPNQTVIYLGWLMAGRIKGYSKAAKLFKIAAVCGVGMGASGSQIEDIRKANALPESLTLFTLQGGFDLQKLRGIYKFMMTVMAKTVGKGLAEKKDRTPDEDEMLDLLTKGGSRVSKENLQTVLNWLRESKSLWDKTS